MRKRKLLLGIVVILTVTVIGITIYSKITSTKLVIYNNKKVVDKGVNEEYIRDIFNVKEIKLNEHGKSYDFTYNDVGIMADLTKEHLEKLNKSLIVNLDKLDIEFETSSLTKDKLNELNKHRSESEYADLVLEDNAFKIKEEKVGDIIDIDRLLEALNNELKINGKNGVELQLSDYFIPFDKSRPSEEYYRTELERYNNFKIEYTNGFSIESSDIIEYLLVKDGTIVFNEELRAKAVKDIDKKIDKGLASYDTVGGDWQFITHSGDTITVSGGTWGDYFDSAKESEYIVEQIAKLQSEQGRIPIKKQEYPDRIPDKYVELNIDEQHLWVYDNGELVMDSPVVTGLKGKMDTPKGVYFISEMQTGRYLRGETYKTWVNKWMRITNRGHGLHDATWRSSREFGGSTYKYDGSHGCINLPKKFAYDLYDFLDMKDCVVIY